MRGNVRSGLFTSSVGTFSTRVTRAMNNAEATPGPFHSFSLSFPPSKPNASRPCSCFGGETSLHEIAPRESCNIGSPSSVKEYRVSAKGCGWRRALAKRMAVAAWQAERILMIICEGLE